MAWIVLGSRQACSFRLLREGIGRQHLWRCDARPFLPERFFNSHSSTRGYPTDPGDSASNFRRRRLDRLAQRETLYGTGSQGVRSPARLTKQNR